MSNNQSVPAEHQVTRGKLLARGGQAFVYLSRRKVDNSLVVEKEFRDTPNPVPTRRRRGDIQDTPTSVVKEISKKLENIEYFVQILLFPTPEHYIMHLEYCDGGNLDTLSFHYRSHGMLISECFIWHVYDSLATALCFLHNGSETKTVPGWKAIVHRDIKPDNVLLQHGNERNLGFPKIKLTDFDFSTFYQRSKCIYYGGLKGWIPPEQQHATTHPRATPAGDVWAVGAVIHDLVIGDEPQVRYVPKLGRETETVEILKADPKQTRLLPDHYGELLEECMCLALRSESKRPTAQQLLQMVGPAAEDHITVVPERMEDEFACVRD